LIRFKSDQDAGEVRISPPQNQPTEKRDELQWMERRYSLLINDSVWNMLFFSIKRLKKIVN